MQKLLGAAALALALAAPTTGSAQASFLGLRIGYAVPFGGITGSTSQQDVIDSVVPLQLDGGFRLGPVDLGGYFAYGFASADSRCTGGCSASVIRVGVQSSLHSQLREGRALWAGFMAGWERLKLSSTGPDFTTTGWEGGLQGGFDFTSSTTGFGPFLSLMIGQFSHIEVGGASGSIPTRKFHETFQVGVRGHFKL